MKAMVEVTNLKKRYGDKQAVDGVSFSVKKGEIFGILGPNGAGKTTTLEMMETLRPIDEGTVLIDGIDVGKNPQKIKYLIGVDGGGSGTRVVVTDREGKVHSVANGAPSALALGIEQAWEAILNTIASAFYHGNLSVPMFSECAIGLGLSSANNIIWKNQFLLHNPGFKIIEVDTDGYTTLLGAHSGSPGSIVALGTGSIGMILNKDGTRKYVSGWGFPSGDEASGSWLGINAIRLAEKVLDGRAFSSPLTDAILLKCGNNPNDLLNWLAKANQNTYASLAPLVFQHAHHDSSANDLLVTAGLEVKLMFQTLDPKLKLPYALCGRLGEALIPFVPKEIKQNLTKAKSDSSIGAIELIRNKI